MFYEVGHAALPLLESLSTNSIANGSHLFYIS